MYVSKNVVATTLGSEAPIKQPFVKRDFSPKKVLLILCPTCKKAVSACYGTAKNEVPTSTRDAILYHLSHLREQAELGNSPMAF